MFTFEDVQQRWPDTILFHKGHNSAIYVESIVDFDQADQRVLMKYYHEKNSSWNVVTGWVNVADISEHVPDLGMINVGIGAYYFTRKATHQFKRGLVPKQMTGVLVGDVDAIANAARVLSPNMPVINPVCVAQYYNPVYPHMLEAVRDVSKGKYLSRAWSKEYAVAAGYSRWPILYYKRHAVGKVKADSIELVEMAAFLREDLQNNTPLHVTIERT